MTEAQLFILAGQSNARGYGSTTAGLPANLSGSMAGCYMWNTATGAFVTYQATVNSDTHTSGTSYPQKWGSEAEFFRQFKAANPSADVYLVKMGVDSSPMSPAGPEACWLPSATELFTTMTGYVNAAKAALYAAGLTPAVKGVLFMQGEEDAEENTESAAYETNLTAFIAGVRSSWGDANTEVILGRILDRRTYSSVVRTAQETVAAADALADWFNTDFYPQTIDTRHYKDQGLVALGHDFFHVYNGTYPAAELGAPTFSNVKLLAGFNGANGATSYTEESASARTATFIGNAQLSTGNAIYGGAAALFDGAGDSITFADADDFSLGNGPFVIQFSANLASLPTNTAFINQWNSSANQRSFAVDRASSGKIQFAYSVTGAATISALSADFFPVVNHVYRFMVERDTSNNVRIYQDGIMIGKANIGSASFFDSNQPVRIGGLTGFTGYALNGVIDEVRIVKGQQLWGSDERFTVNASEFPRS